MSEQITVNPQATSSPFQSAVEFRKSQLRLAPLSSSPGSRINLNDKVNTSEWYCRLPPPLVATRSVMASLHNGPVNIYHMILTGVLMIPSPGAVLEHRMGQQLRELGCDPTPGGVELTLHNQILVSDLAVGLRSVFSRSITRWAYVLILKFCI